MDVLVARRSVRAFQNKPLAKGTTEKLIKAFCWAPSPLHQQPWSFVVISGSEAKAEVKAVSEAARQAVVDGNGPSWAAKYDMSFLADAPAIIAVAYDPAKGGLGRFFSQPHGALSAASAGIQNLMLAATEMGLQSLWFTFFDPEKMKAALGIPAELDLAGLIPIGEALGEAKAPPRKEALVFVDKYGA